MGRFDEDNLQMQVAKYLDLKKVLWCHVANERKTKSRKFGGILKAKGVKSGVPDCLIFEPTGDYVGLALELKVERSNGLKKDGTPREKTRTRLSDNQKEWLEKLEDKEWFTAVAYNFDEAVKIVNEYLSWR